MTLQTCVKFLELSAQHLGRRTEVRVNDTYSRSRRKSNGSIGSETLPPALLGGLSHRIWIGKGLQHAFYIVDLKLSEHALSRHITSRSRASPAFLGVDRQRCAKSSLATTRCLTSSTSSSNLELRI